MIVMVKNATVVNLSEDGVLNIFELPHDPSAKKRVMYNVGTVLIDASEAHQVVLRPDVSDVSFPAGHVDCFVVEHNNDLGDVVRCSLRGRRHPFRAAT